MHSSNLALFDQFIQNYTKGDFLRALQGLILSPQIKYDTLQSHDNQWLHFLINYADACVFKGASDFSKASQVLLEILNQSFDSHPQLRLFVEQLSEEYQLFEELLKTSKEFSFLTELDIYTSALPDIYQSFIQQKARVCQGWQQFQLARPSLAQWIEGKNGVWKQPWHPFAYAQPLTIRELNPQGEIPLIFLEPLESVDYADFLQPYCQQECLWVIETAAHFFHLLQFSELQTFWQNPAIGIYILELYPQTQFALQNWHWQTLKTFRPVLMTSRSDFERIIPLFEVALKRCLTQPLVDFENETLVANWLYKISKNFIYNREAERYGKSRCIACSLERSAKNWLDPHKGAIPLQADVGPLIVDYFKEEIKKMSHLRQARSFASNSRLRVAHVVPQIVDGGHAPTRLLKTLCQFANLDCYDVSVISTEFLIEHQLEYPLAPFLSFPSDLRGKETIQFLKERGISAWINPEVTTFVKSAHAIQQILKALKIDIAVFHGPDEVNILCASMADVPMRVFFDHGTLPSHACFDLAILSTQEGQIQNQERFKHTGMKSQFLHFCVDVKQGWKEKPYTRDEIGLPADCFILTTISNHLDTRLTLTVCQAIGEILQRCPQAVYAPMGKVLHPERLRTFFKPYGVNDRVIFLGPCENPSQYARSMDLYLNEFPIGSGLALLDAMAAGCPIVSMYDEQGNQAARYGGTYFGIDHVIKTGLKKEYVELACRLIQEPLFYQKWSQHALKQYEKYADVRQYVENFEKLLQNFAEVKKENTCV